MSVAILVDGSFFLKRYRKWALLGAFVLAAILTPTPDPFNQVLMALPMYIFYEVGIVSAGIFAKKRAGAGAEQAPAEAGTGGLRSGGLAAAAGPNVASDDPYVSVPPPGQRP